jgi:hypothetical protein
MASRSALVLGGGDAAFAGATPLYAAVTVGSKSPDESESLTRRLGRS